MNFLLGDGSVRNVSVTIDMNAVFPAMSTMANGEVVTFN
ncbi:MAG: H-X9-DG-CTERM domain-containing protein [Gemmataceae bacterium]